MSLSPGLYRIRNLALGHDAASYWYLQLDSSSPFIVTGSRDQSKKEQIWRITQNTSGKYTICSTANYLPLKIKPGGEGGDDRPIADRQVEEIAPEWSFGVQNPPGEPRWLDVFSIIPSSKSTSVLLPVRTPSSVILAPADEHEPHHFWVFEPVNVAVLDPAPLADGTYTIHTPYQFEVNAAKYLNLEPDRHLEARALTAGNYAEQWIVRRTFDGTYAIVNVGNERAALTPVPSLGGDSPLYKNTVRGNLKEEHGTWTLEPVGNGSFSVGAVGVYSLLYLTISGQKGHAIGLQSRIAQVSRTQPWQQWIFSPC